MLIPLNRMPAIRKGLPGARWEVGYCSWATGSWLETVSTYNNRGHALKRPQGLWRRL